MLKMNEFTEILVDIMSERTATASATVNIDFEEAFEDAISAAVSRLDEIGDLVDGEVTTDEALNLLQLLGEP